MPTYDYVCEKCSYEWSQVKTLHEHEKQPKPVCPKCHGRQVHQKISSFMPVTPKKT